MRYGYVYIMANSRPTLYTGVTNNLERRMYEHRNGLVEGFTKKYNCKKLVFFEEYLSIIDALNREKQIKKWRRSKKEWLIKTVNSTWRDLLTD